MTRFRVPLLILSASALVAIAVGFARQTRSSSVTVAPATASALQGTFIDVFRKVSPSVVQIRTSSGLGSGIVFDTKGDIVTNDHVVNGSTSFTVTTSTGKILKGTLVGEFQPDDLAVIKVDGTGLHPATFLSSSKLQVGQIAIAIGNPLGLSSSVTEGIISALNRQEPEGNGVILQNAIQTSAAINPGNSGGALVDIEGRVIGIPTLAAADPSLGGAAAGIGFAINGETVVDIAGQLARSGKVTSSHRAYLGVQIGDTGGSGVYIGVISPGGPAAKAGLVAGDVITSIDGKPTPTSDDLGTVLATLTPGQTVKVAITHQNRTTATVRVVLGDFAT